MVDRRHQLLTYAATFKPRLWAKVASERERVMDTGLPEDKPRSLESLVELGVKRIVFEWGDVLFQVPIKERSEGFKPRYEELQGILRREQLLGGSEGHAERWVSRSGIVYPSLSMMLLFLDDLLDAKFYGFPNDITHANMKPKEGLYDELKAEELVWINPHHVLSMPTERNAQLYFLFRTQAQEIVSHYINPVKKMLKQSELPAREALEPMTIESRITVSDVEAESQYRIGAIRDYQGVLKNIRGLLSTINTQLYKVKPSRQFRHRKLRAGGTVFELDYARGVSGVYLSIPSYGLVINHATQLKPNRGEGKRVALFLRVNASRQRADLRRFLRADPK